MKQVFNPFLPPHVCIADGEAHVFGNRVYLFGSHDKEGGDTFCMEDYEFFSAPVDDLTDWSSKGRNYSAKQDPLFSEERKYLYAPDVVQGNDGRFYLYYCLAGYQNPVSVAVCDTPDGKYEFYGHVRFPDGSLCRRFVPFDPGVINDNGTIRLYYGTWWPFDQMPKILMPIFRKVEAGMFGKTVAEIKAESKGVMGAVTLTLADDMLTVVEEPKQFLHTDSRGTPFESHTAIPWFANGHGMVGHGFFEASSIRKIGDTYYFVYSSQNNHELCYATSKYPDRDFRFGGTIVSNGDVGYNGRKEKDRANTTGTTHGSIECINGQWYVFYHRMSHGTDYSRQICAEKITILPDGSIPQVQMTSCGLNKGNLRGTGKYPATICGNLTNGKMPHTANRIKKGIPMVTHDGNECFVANASKGTRIVYRYFDLSKTNAITVTARGNAAVQICFSDTNVGIIHVDSQDWKEYELIAHPGNTHAELRFAVVAGSVDFLFFELI